MPEMEGGGDFLMIADPTTFRVLPWAPPDRLGAVRHLFHQWQAGAVLDAPPLSPARCRSWPMPGSTTWPASRSNSHIFKLDNPRSILPPPPGRPEAPEVSLISQGFQYLTETRFDQMEPVLEILRRDVVALGLPLRSSRSSSVRANASSPSTRKSGLRRPTP